MGVDPRCKNRQSNQQTRRRRKKRNTLQPCPLVARQRIKSEHSGPSVSLAVSALTAIPQRVSSPSASSFSLSLWVLFPSHSGPSRNSPLTQLSLSSWLPYSCSTPRLLGTNNNKASACVGECVFKHSFKNKKNSFYRLPYPSHPWLGLPLDPHSFDCDCFSFSFSSFFFSMR